MLVVGLMSGTSADGVDAALVDVNQSLTGLGVQTVAWTTLPYPADLAVRIVAASNPTSGKVDEVCRLNAILGEWFARAARLVVEQARLTFDDVDLVASHGQTIYHAVGRDEVIPSTLQIAAPAVIAERTGRTVVADFRPRDVAAGGQGAPLASFVDYLLFADSQVARALQNVGGIGNVTYLPPGAKPSDVIAFDTGPGNMVVDTLARLLFDLPFDRDGLIAATGQIDDDLIERVLTDPFFSRSPPKSTGREQFGRVFADDFCRAGRDRGLGDNDLIATATALTARSIADSYRRFLPRVDEIVISGGGGNNATLVRWILEALATDFPTISARRIEELGIASDAKEAIVFAILGYETIHGRVGTLPRCTGASRAAVLGSIVPGENYRELLRKVVEESTP